MAHMQSDTDCRGHSTVIFDPAMVEYNFGEHHPLHPVRVELTMALATELGAVGPQGLELRGAPKASEDQLAVLHAPAFIEAVQRASLPGASPDFQFGLGTEDNPIFEGMHDAARHVAGASIEAARLVWNGDYVHAANVGGGLHHAMADHASGFCIYNDIALAIQYLLDNGAQRVAYVDVDVHHGDGVERLFYNDPRVLTISLHETGKLLFPGTGFPADLGGPDAQGSSVNVALPPGTGDGGWLRAFHAVVPPILRAFAPEVLVTQHGCDSHRDDPLAHLMLTVDGQRASYQALHELAHEVSGGKWIALGGGGYALTKVVPRAWTHLLAIVAGQQLEPATDIPGAWRQLVADRTGEVAPLRMTDGGSGAYRPWELGQNLDTWLDQAIAETRRELFGFFGLDADGY